MKSWLIRALDPARVAWYLVTRWLRRRFSPVPGIARQTLLETPRPEGCTVERVIWRAHPPVHLPLPRNLDGRPHRLFRRHATVRVFDRYLARIRGARIEGEDGFLYLPDGRVLLEHHFFFRRHVENHDIYFARKPPTRRIEGPVFPLLGFCPAAHYHWMTEVLYRLHGVLEALPAETSFLVPRRATTVHRDVLAVFGIEPERCVDVSEEDCFEVEDLWYAPPVARSGFDVPEVGSWLRDRVRAHFLGAEAPARVSPDGARLYISRRRALHRRVANEEELLAQLSPLGYRPVLCEGMTLEQQVRAFADARAIIAPHGAGLVNLLFAPAGGRVLELFPRRLPVGGTCYWSLASVVGWDYAYLQGRRPGGDADPGADFGVPAEFVRRWAEEAETL